MGVDDRAYSILTVSKLKRLHDNYVLETTRGEDRTSQDALEEDEFLDAVISTSVMQDTRRFLIERGILQSLFLLLTTSTVRLRRYTVVHS